MLLNWPERDSYKQASLVVLYDNDSTIIEYLYSAIVGKSKALK